MSKDSSAKYYQKTKNKKQKRLVKDIKVFQRWGRKKSNNVDVNDIKIYLKMKN